MILGDGYIFNRQGTRLPLLPIWVNYTGLASDMLLLELRGTGL
jgi:hypothetical protein